MRYKLKLVSGEQYTVDEAAKTALDAADAGVLVPVTVSLSSGQTKEISIGKNAIATIEGVSDDPGSDGVNWGSLKRRR